MSYAKRDTLGILAIGVPICFLAGGVAPWIAVLLAVWFYVMPLRWGTRPEARSLVGHYLAYRRRVAARGGE